MHLSVLLQFLPPVVITIDATSVSGPFISEFWVTFILHWNLAVSMQKAHIAFQETHTVVQMLHIMAVHFSGKVVPLHLHNTNNKDY